MAPTSTYGDLKKDFEDVRSSHATVVVEKTEVEKNRAGEAVTVLGLSS
jgi:hypothetical protein